MPGRPGRAARPPSTCTCTWNTSWPACGAGVEDRAGTPSPSSPSCRGDRGGRGQHLAGQRRVGRRPARPTSAWWSFGITSDVGRRLRVDVAEGERGRRSRGRPSPGSRRRRCGRTGSRSPRHLAHRSVGDGAANRSRIAASGRRSPARCGLMSDSRLPATQPGGEHGERGDAGGRGAQHLGAQPHGVRAGAARKAATSPRSSPPSGPTTSDDRRRSPGAASVGQRPARLPRAARPRAASASSGGHLSRWTSAAGHLGQPGPAGLLGRLPGGGGPPLPAPSPRGRRATGSRSAPPSRARSGRRRPRSSPARRARRGRPWRCPARPRTAGSGAALVPPRAERRRSRLPLPTGGDHGAAAVPPRPSPSSSRLPDAQPLHGRRRGGPRPVRACTASRGRAASSTQEQRRELTDGDAAVRRGR